jgi:hypothetical protein
MTCTNKQVGILMNKIKKHNQIIAAAKAGMNVKTARKYLRIGKLPSELKKVRKYRTRKDPFLKHWSEIETMLESAPELQATTLLPYLMGKYPGYYSDKQLRCLQKKLKIWRAEHGKDKPVIFLQNILPGRQSQSDWTNMNQLDICLGGKPYPHLLFHFMLPYSRWESFTICHSESFDSLALGFERAVWELGGVLPEHRTDNLSAATKRCGGSREFTERWEELLAHYNVKPSRNNPGVSHENGSVEKSHDTFKQTVNQHLLLRGSRNFIDLKDYELFLTNIKEKRNSSRKERLAEELDHLQELPHRKWNAPTILPVRVNPSSVVTILSIPYSVPSRLISYSLKAYVYAEEIELYYGNKCLQKMPRVHQGYAIDYRHIIDSLVRKPGAFAGYQYHESLFPRPVFRRVYDQLTGLYPSKGHKIYLKILQLAKMYGELDVAAALAILLESATEATIDNITALLDNRPKTIYSVEISQPLLWEYDQLHGFKTSEAA